MDAEQVQSGPLSWKYNPWTEQPQKTLSVFVIDCAAIVLVAYSYRGDPALNWFMLLAALFMFGMTLSLLVPIAYTLDEKGVTVRFLGVPSFRLWQHYRNVYVHKNGIFLTSMRKPSGLDPFRGHFLLYGESTRDLVVSYAKRYIKSEA
jgi:hypothetical protein